VLDALGVPIEFVLQEVAAMGTFGFAKTASRSVVGSMNEFVFMAGRARDGGPALDLIRLSLWLAGTPCGPLRAGDGFPDRRGASVVARVLGA